MRYILCLLTGLAINVAPAIAAGPGEETADKSQPVASEEQLAFYSETIQPLFEENCYKCHGPGKSKGGLRLTSRESVLNGGDTGPAANLEDPAASLMLEALNYESYEMPPSGKLASEQIDLVKRWIEMGCPMTETEGLVTTQ